MPFQMQAAQFPHGGWPEATDRVPGAAAEFPKGTLVTFNTGTQRLDEHAGGATVTNIAGVSLEGVRAGDADNPSGTVNFTKATRSNVYVASLVNAGGVVQVPDAANLNVNYGLLKVGSGQNAWWGVDESNVTDVVVEVIDIDLERDLVYFKFIESAIQEI